MAKVMCTVSYSPTHEEVRRTYHIEFDDSDTIEINTTTKELALRVEDKNPAAKRLVKRWKTQRPTTSLAPPHEPADVFVLDHPVKLRARLPVVATTRFTATFTMPTADLAKFECGYYETDPDPGEKKGFKPYEGGQGVGVPDIPSH